MPKKARELSAIEVRRMTSPGLYAVGGVAGLYFQVSGTGGRSWILRTVIGTKRRDIGLGGFPSVSLAQAREAARKAKEQIQQGIDPVVKRKSTLELLAADQITFDELATQYLAYKTPEFRNTKHTAQWHNTLSRYASPIIGKLPVAKIELAHIVQVLHPLWTSKTETATRLRGRIESVLNYATVNGYRTGDNPARWRGNLDAVLPKPRRLSQVVHYPALPVDQLPHSSWPIYASDRG